VLNEYCEVRSWNRLAGLLMELDPATCFSQPYERHALVALVTPHFRERILNWEETISIFAGLHKSRFEGLDAAGEFAYIKTVATCIMQHNPEDVSTILTLLTNAPSLSHPAATTWHLRWRTGDGTELSFTCLLRRLSDNGRTRVNDCHPADVVTWNWLAKGQRPQAREQNAHA
jgi:hypothetical protein